MNGRFAKALPWLTALGGAGVLAGFLVHGPARFWANWIVWFLFLFTTALGCLFLVGLEHLVAARWSVPLRRVPERLSGLLFLGAPAALVALGALPALFPGSRPEALGNPHLAGKALWLGAPFFTARTVACVVLGLVSWTVLVAGSLRQDATGDPRFNVRARRFAPVFMFLFALIVTVLAMDWVSGLTPEWYSDIIGVYLFSGTFLAGLAATTLAIGHLKGQGRLQGVRRDHLYNLGGFMFAFTVFWSYIAFAQYLLMWYGNLPLEAAWYSVRLHGGWYFATLALALLHFLVPFFALATRAAKEDPRRLRWVAWLILGTHLLDLTWLIVPTLGQGFLCSWPEGSFALFFLGGGLTWVRHSFSHGADMPVGDPFLRQGLEFRL